MAISFIKVYFDFEERTAQLTDDERGRLLLAMLRYAKDNRLPDLGGNERFVFPVFKMDIDRDLSAYDAKVRNGGKGGRPKTEKNLTKPNLTERNLTKANFEEQEQEQEQEQDKSIGVKPPRPRFTPPTVDDVKAYATERGYNISAERFVDYYTANGWKVGKNPMKDWRAAVRSWAARDQGEGYSKPAQKNPALDYQQREYHEEDFGDNFYYNVLEAYGGDDP